MSVYIQAISAISPQHSFGDVPFPAEAIAYTGDRLKCIEPEYAAFIDPKLIRRMSRIIRMGVATAQACLREAAVKNPDAIVTGTAYGCLADTGVFLSAIIGQGEELLSPTAFIQSTHNTVGGQIALMLQCHGYNNTFVHRGFSFESALLDGMLLLAEGEADHVLVGGLDEITDSSHAILRRFGLYRRGAGANLDLIASDAMRSPGLSSNSIGAIAGEGAAFFMLTGRPSPDAYARLDALTTFYKPKDVAEVEQHILSFLEGQDITLKDIDLIITGNNGDGNTDELYLELQRTIFKNNTSIPYKHLSGEYPTSTSFALWMAAKIIRSGGLPAAPDRMNDGTDGVGARGGAIKRILIYNHFLQIHHSLMLVSAC